ncbi:MAG: hypothetical protein KME35_20770 [Aphanocapsa sp. GSE-SYN-MK-11-07L]|jgi:hypothetical protein|nr:hypothetical protein [Aphanocapsa sp. GSE-SYN-MK-11-07L]
MLLKKQAPGSSTAANFILASLVGLIASGCTDWAASRGQQGGKNLSANPLNQTAQITSTEHTSTTNAQHANSQADSPDQFGLGEGMSYREARKILIQKGWHPHLGGDSPNLSNTSVKEFFELGYQEVKDCSGTGMGLCRFEFTNKAGELLVVSATMAESKNTERVVWRWFIEQRTNNHQQRSSSFNNTAADFYLLSRTDQKLD